MHDNYYKAALIVTILVGYLFISASTGILPDQLSTANDYPIVKISSYKYDELSNSLSYIGSGSGTIISRENHILTNFHVISNSENTKPADVFEVCSVFNLSEDPSCLYTASLTSFNKDNDVAILKLSDIDVDGDRTNYLGMMSWEKSKIPKVDDEVSLIGFPDTGEGTITVTRGNISGFFEDNVGLWVKFDSKMSYGNSGGAVIDSRGKLIGVPSYTVTSIDTLGYFKPTSEISDFITNGIKAKKIINEKATLKLKDDLRLRRSINGKLSYNHATPKFKISLPDNGSWEFGAVSLQDNIISIDHLSQPVNAYIQIREFPYEISDEEFLRELKTSFDELSIVYKFADSKSYTYFLQERYGEGYYLTHGNYGFDIYWNTPNGIPDEERKNEWRQEFQTITNTIILAEAETASKMEYLKHTKSAMEIKVPWNWAMSLKDDNQDKINLLHQQSDLKMSIDHKERPGESIISPRQHFQNNIAEMRENLTNFQLKEENVNTTLFGKPAYKIRYTHEVGRIQYEVINYRFYAGADDGQEVSLYITNRSEDFEVKLSIAKALLKKIQLKL